MFVLARPDVAPVPPAAGAVFGLRNELVGVDGSVWDLSDWTSGVFLAADGVLGLMEAPAERYVSTSPAVAGSRWRGGWVAERPVSWRVHLWAQPGMWLDLQRAWWAALSRDATATWRVHLPDGAWRALQVRLTTTGPHVFARDPVAAGWETYTVALVAEDPWWYGEPVPREWSDSPGSPFFGGPDGAGSGPPFFISSSAYIGSATMTNPGDQDAWPVWTVTATGEVSQVTMAVGASRLRAVVDLDPGDVLVVDTDPRRQSTTVNGTRTRGVLVEHEFAPIPPGGSVALALTVVGEGTVQAQIVPRWSRCL